ncbi:MAG: DinB family protein [Rhodothermales bacterium]
MITVDYIRTLYAYTDWANTRMLSAVDRVPPDRRHRDMGSSFPSMHDTLVHMVSSEWIWMARWTGTSPAGMEDADSPTDLDAVRSRWEALAARRTVFVGELTDDDLQRPLAYRNSRNEAFEQPLWELMCHTANHASYHRGQVTTMIRQLDGEPVSTDMIAYFRSDAYQR